MPTDEPSDDSGAREWVAVPFAAFLDTDAFDPDPAWFRKQMTLIQELRRIRGKRLHTLSAEDVDAPDHTTLDEIEEAIIRKRIDEMRPGATWSEVAESLGVTKKTLWRKRMDLGLMNE